MSAGAGTEEVTLLMRLSDKASAPVKRIEKKIGGLGRAGKVAAAGLKAIARVVAKIGSAGLRVFDAVTRRIRGLIRWVKLAVVAFGALQIRNAIRINAQIERFTMTLTTLYRSASRARDMLKYTFEFAWKTPFSIEEVQTAAKQLVGIGANAKKWLKPLANIASALGVPLTQTLTGFRYLFSGAGGMARRSFRYMGIDIAQAGIRFDAQGQMAGNMQENLDKFYAWAQERFKEMAARLAKTFYGTVSNIRIRFQLFLMNLFHPFFEKLKKDLTALFDWMGAPGEGALGKIAAAWTGPLARLYDKLMNPFKRFAHDVLKLGWGQAFANVWRDMQPALLKSAKVLFTVLGKAAAAAFATAFKSGWAGKAAAVLGGAWLARQLGIGALAGAGAKAGLGGLAKLLGIGAAGGAAAKGAGPAINWIAPNVGLTGLGAGGGAAAGKAGALAAVGGMAGVAIIVAAVLAILGMSILTFRESRDPLGTFNQRTGKHEKGWLDRQWGRWSEFMRDKGKYAMGLPGWLLYRSSSRGGPIEDSRQRIETSWQASMKNIRGWAEKNYGRGGLRYWDFLMAKTGDASVAIRTFQQTVAASFDAVAAKVKAVADAFRAQIAEADALRLRMKALKSDVVDEAVRGWTEMTLKASTEEERRLYYLKEIKRVSDKIAGIDYAKITKLEALGAEHQRHIDWIREKLALNLKVAEQMDAIREKAVGMMWGDLRLGPKGRAEKRWFAERLAGMTGEDIGRAVDFDKRFAGVFWKYGGRDLVTKEQISGLNRYAGLGELPRGAAAFSAIELERAQAEKRRLEREEEKTRAVERLDELKTAFTEALREAVLEEVKVVITLDEARAILTVEDERLDDAIREALERARETIAQDFLLKFADQMAEEVSRAGMN